MPGIIRHAIVGIVGGYLLSLIIGTLGLPLTTFLALNIIWALLPDLPALWGDYWWDDKPIMNLCWFHYTMDKTFKEKNIWW